eukprot:TRINITY_DN1530_c0_g1_i1.p1 TRINITY_DN1530_c0_g1~~TRINITY_DN1530_c0_g1_i1.p1  ORF type:complete len:530 (-),score=81.84 TRINITY_DN1530_c0_g1_i1:66-1655(-)
MMSGRGNVITCLADDLALSLRAFFGRENAKDDGSPPRKQSCLLLVAACVILTHDLYQLTFMAIGATIIFCVHKPRVQTGKKAPPTASMSPVASTKFEDCNRSRACVGGWKSRQHPIDAIRTMRHDVTASLPILPKHEGRRLTMKSIEQSVFRAIGWEAEVAELVCSIIPTQEVHTTVKCVADKVRARIQRSFPEAEVLGLVAGDFRRGKAFNVAVPEVDIVVCINHEALVNRFMKSLCRTDHVWHSNCSKVQKLALRECTEILVSTRKYKFRRSAYGSLEPKVTLLAPSTSGGQEVPIDLTVNASMPLQNTALLTECGRMESRARDLILLVRRWTKDRGVCHAAKRYLSPYSWTLLTIYFLQVGVVEEGSLLPPLEQFDLPSSFCGKQASASSEPRWTPVPFVGERKSTAFLFKEFMRFYSTQFDWRNEAVSIRLGKRAPPSAELPFHRMACDDADGQTVVGMTIEDPFLVTRNCGTCLNSRTLTRTRAELHRAHELCSRDASLTELLERWMPPESPKSGESAHVGMEE